MDNTFPVAGAGVPDAVAAAAIGTREGVSAARTWWLAALFVLTMLVFLYRGYPLQGMVVEESWNLYAWSTSVHEHDAMGWGRLLFARRGGSSLIRHAIRATGATPVAVNLAVVGSWAATLALFAAVIWKLGFRRELVPVVAAATLYPFASGARFWQILIYHHAAVILFLVTLILYLVAIAPRGPGLAARVACAIASLACFWASVATQEHAVLMPLLLVYIALWETNGRRVAVRFSRWWSSAVALSLCYLAVTIAFALIFVVQGHPRMSATSGSHPWASSPLVREAAVAASAVLTLTSTVIANTVGYVGYPLLTVVTNRAILWNELGRWLPWAAVAAALGTAVLVLSLRPGASPAPGTDAGRARTRFALALGTLWAALIYVPVSTSFAYPRVVGQSADRVNMLAFLGVALCIGSLVTAAAERVRGRATVKVAGVSFVVIVVMLAHLYVQREYWVEAAAKERAIVFEVLDGLGRDAGGGRKAVVLLEREAPVVTVRARLAAALQQQGMVAKAIAVSGVVLGRHFTEAGEMEVTAFHLHGIPLFGGGADNARWIAGNYARRFGRASSPMYRVEQGLSVQETPEAFVLAYQDAPETRTEYAKRDYDLVTVKLAESFFAWRGAVTYTTTRGRLT